MEMILTGLSELSTDWRAWAVAALVALKATSSIYLYLHCPVLCGRVHPSEAEIAAARDYRFRPPLSYLLIMLAGITLAVVGLYLLGDATYGPLALGMLVVGVFMFSTEPNRLAVQGAVMEVIATTETGGDTNLLARDRLRGAHLSRALIETSIVATVLVMLCLL
ncbi:MAG: hypothetical protein WD969_16900 [Paracoccaceae bacterium]